MNSPRVEKRKVVCLCGSTRFKRVFETQARLLTLLGHIVLTVHVFTHADREDLTDQQLDQLKALHLAKIDMADEVFILNVGGYIGDGLADEIAYAMAQGTSVVYLESET